jgi:hypothetical protein
MKVFDFGVSLSLVSVAKCKIARNNRGFRTWSMSPVDFEWNAAGAGREEGDEDVTDIIGDVEDEEET